MGSRGRPRIWAPRSAGAAAACPAPARAAPAAALPTPLPRPAPRRDHRPDGRGGIELVPLGLVEPRPPTVPPPPGPRRQMPAAVWAVVAAVLSALITVLLLWATGPIGGEATVIEREQAETAPG